MVVMNQKADLTGVINFRVPLWVQQDIYRLADKCGLSVAEYLRKVLIEHVGGLGRARKIHQPERVASGG